MFLVTNENMGLCLYIRKYTTEEIQKIYTKTTCIRCNVGKTKVVSTISAFMSEDRNELPFQQAMVLEWQN